MRKPGLTALIVLMASWFAAGCSSDADPALTDAAEDSSVQVDTAVTEPDTSQQDASGDGDASGSEDTAESQDTSNAADTTLAVDTSVAPDTTPPTPSTTTDEQLEAFYAENGGEDALADGFRELIEGMLRAEDEVFAGDFEAASSRLAALFADHSIGTWDGWFFPSTPDSIHVGNPPAYYGLRMLQQIIDDQPAVASAPTTAMATMKVIMPGCSQGPIPTTLAEFEAGTATIKQRFLDPAIRANDYAIVRQSLKLWQRYVLAATDGRLGVELEFVELPELCVTLNITTEPRISRIGNTASVFAALGADADADWYWILYPSGVPGEFPDFATTEFISGGMGVAPNGGPLLLGDDLWLTRKPPHLGSGPYTEVERRIYLPQWMIHEHYHHFYREWPEFGLEETGHQWFDRSTWPDDFVGKFEPDYYTESLNKRLKTATPPMHVKLRYAGPPPELFASMSIDDILGTYQRQPAENAWHTGSIEVSADGGYRWTNAAGVSWSVTDDVANGRLLTGADSPYPELNGFFITLARDEDGEFTTTVEGLRYGGELYVRQ